MDSIYLFGNPGQAIRSIDEFLAELPQERPRMENQAGSATDNLTAREAEVLCLIAEGATNGEIAERLVVSIRTVERHITHIYGKIGARGKADATSYALRHSLVH